MAQSVSEEAMGDIARKDIPRTSLKVGTVPMSVMAGAGEGEVVERKQDGGRENLTVSSVR